MGGIGYRAARPEDAGPLGALHVAAWRETYAGLLPAARLDGLSAEGRAAMWRAALADGSASVFVAESGGRLVGFGACGPQRDGALAAQGYDGEIGALYVLQSRQRAGVGKALMRLLAGALLARGRHAASLWVLRENEAARAFYERLGGTVVGEKTEEEQTELAYGWRDLSVLD